MANTRKFGDLEQGDMFCTAEARWVKLADPKYYHKLLAWIGLWREDIIGQ